MRTSLVYLLALIGLSTAISISWGSASQSSCVYDKRSRGTQALGAITKNIRSPKLWGSQESVCRSGKRDKELLQSAKTTLNVPKNMPKARTTRLQPNVSACFLNNNSLFLISILQSWGSIKLKLMGGNSQFYVDNIKRRAKLYLTGNKQTTSLGEPKSVSQSLLQKLC